MNQSTNNAFETGYETLVASNDAPSEQIHSLYLMVGGARCANCIQKIESAVKADPHVTAARLNFSTGRMSISWTGDVSLANTYAARIKNLGYSVSPFQQNIAVKQDDDENRFLLLCLGVAGFAMGNIMLLSVGLWISDEQTMGLATRELFHWISALIAMPAILFSGRPFFRSAYSALKNKTTNMDVPISVALIFTSLMSLFEVWRGGDYIYFDSAVMLMFFLLIGRYLDFRARCKAKTAASDLMQALSGFASVKDGDLVRRVLIRDLCEGMEVIVAAGERFPADGVIADGETILDMSLITGETMPVHTREHEKVYSGAVNLGDPVTMKVSKIAEESLLSDIVKLIEKAEQGQARYVRIADRAARLYTPVVHGLAVLAFIFWFGFQGLAWQQALMISVTVLIITCPCALGLAVPIVQVLAASILMKRGVFLKSGDAFERLANIDTAIFDKTGTLTTGALSLIGEYDPDNVKMAASLACHSNHPLSKAITANYQGDLYPSKNIKEHRGVGIAGIVNGRPVRLGSRSWCGDENAQQTDDIELWLAIEGRAPEALVFTDMLRADSKATVAQLQAAHIDTILLSGDRSAVADSVASEVGIKTVYAEKTPAQKYDIMDALMKNSQKTLMVGDGLNDAPVLSRAYVSMAPGTAVDIAKNAADIIFMGDHLNPVFSTYRTACATQKLVKQNFTLAILYNMIAIPAAFCGLITPMIAALAMSGSSLTVIANSFRLRIEK